jgi:hypothetical protein
MIDAGLIEGEADADTEMESGGILRFELSCFLQLGRILPLLRSTRQ